MSDRPVTYEDLRRLMPELGGMLGSLTDRRCARLAARIKELEELEQEGREDRRHLREATKLLCEVARRSAERQR